MTTDELELERLTQEVMEYVRNHLEITVDYNEWVKGVSYLEFKSYIREVIKTGAFTFGRNDSFIAPMYKSFVLGLRIGKARYENNNS